jgi:hypothetical protein
VTLPRIVYCSECGADLPEDSQFCRKCGQAVKRTTAAGGSVAASPAPLKSNRPDRLPLFFAVVLIVGLLGWFIDHQMHEVGTPVQTSATSQTPLRRLHRVTIGTGSITVAAANSTYYTLPVPATATLVRVQGHYTATGGTGNDIEVYLLNQDQFTNWQNGHPTPTFYNGGRVTVGDIDATLPNEEGTYYLVFNNKFSMLTPKAVQETITMTYFSQ